MSKSWIATLIAMAWILSLGPFFIVGMRIDLGIPLVRLLTGGPIMGLGLGIGAVYLLRGRVRTPFEAAAWPFAAAVVFVDIAFLLAAFLYGFR